MTECCKGESPAGAPVPLGVCPQCGAGGKSVERVTVEALVTPELRHRLDGTPYAFCDSSACPVVYYTAAGERISTFQLRVRVGIKETEDPITACYCFGITERMIREEIERTGRSTASARIRAEVKAGHCRCEVENPSGRCCLGEVSRVEKRGVRLRNESGGAATTITTTGGLVVAFLASLCCLGPWLLPLWALESGPQAFWPARPTRSRRCCRIVRCLSV